MTAGLKWPPEMWPTADAMIAIARPWASATPRMPLDANMIDPIPTKISVNVPISSATPRRRGSYSTRRGYGSGRTERRTTEVRYGGGMAGDAGVDTTQMTSCPHCRKPFEAELIEGGLERHRGFKCPHCKLFVPESRVEDAPLSRDRD